MAIPTEILAVKRPKSTKVKKSGNRYLVIKRTSVRRDGRNVPVDLGTIGEILNGQYVEIRKEPRKSSKEREIDIKDYGLPKLFDDECKSLLKDLTFSFDTKEAKQIYVIALLRAISPDLRNRDIEFAFQTSFLSEMYPGLPLSENTISKLLEGMGMSFRKLADFMRRRVEKFSDTTQVIDGTLIDNNSSTNSMSEFSRKAKAKGNKDLTLVYSFDIESQEPVTMKPYAGNMLDSTSIVDFLTTFDIKNKLMVLDKGFYSKSNVAKFRELGLSYLIPLKRDSKQVRESGILSGINNHLKGYGEGPILYKKVKNDESTFLYAYKDPKAEYEQKTSYITFKEKKGEFNPDKYAQIDEKFGVIVFESNANLDPLEAYEAYARRWDIETMFQLFKGIIDVKKVGVQGDYRVIATEFINYISVIMSQKIKARLRRTPLNSGKKGKQSMLSEKYSFKQLYRYLEKIKKVRSGETSKWVTSKTVKYVEEIAKVLGI